MAIRIGSKNKTSAPSQKPMTPSTVLNPTTVPIASKSPSSVSGNLPKPLASPPKSGEDVFKSIVADQKKKAIDVVKKVTAHNIDIMTKGTTVTAEQYQKLYDEFILSLKNKMEGDASEFRNVIEKYITDLNSHKVDRKNIIDEAQLEEFGALGVKGEMLKSAGMRVASSVRRTGKGLTSEDVGVQRKIFQSPERKDNAAGKLLEKLDSFASLFKDKDKKEEGTPDFDKSRFRGDAEYRKDMLEYLKDISRNGKEMTAAQSELLKKVQDGKALDKFIGGARDRMTPGGKIAYDLGKGVGKGAASLGKGLFNLGKNVLGRKKVPDPVNEGDTREYNETNIEGKTLAKIERSTSPRGTEESVFPDMSEESLPRVFGTKRLSKDKPLTNDSTSVDEAQVKQAMEESDSDDVVQEQQMSLLEKIEKNTDPDNPKNKGANKTGGGGLMGGLSGLMGGGAGPSALKKGGGALLGAAKTVGRFLNPVTKVAATGAAGWAIGTGINKAYEKVSGQSLGSDIYDLFNPEKDQATEDKKSAQNLYDKRISEGKKFSPESAKFFKSQGVKVDDKLIDKSLSKKSATEKVKPPAIESAAKNTSEKLTTATDTAAAKKEEKKDAKTAAQTQAIISAPTTNSNPTTVLGGSSRPPDSKQNPRNPDNSFRTWMNNRSLYH